jgi:ribosomal protein L35
LEIDEIQEEKVDTSIEVEMPDIGETRDEEDATNHKKIQKDPWQNFFIPYLTLRETILCAKTCKAWNKYTLKYKDRTSLTICEEKIPKDVFYHLRYLLRESPIGLENLIIHTIQFIENKSALFATNIKNKLLQWIDSKLHDEHVFEIQYENIKQLTVLTNEGTVITSGDLGDPSDEIQNQLKDVKTIVFTERAFAALTIGGHVIPWGYEQFGGTPSTTSKNQLKDIKMIFSNEYAFAALNNQGDVITWGHPRFGGNPSQEIQNQLKDINMIFCTHGAFAALSNGGKVIVWGAEAERPSKKIKKKLKTHKGAYKRFKIRGGKKKSYKSGHSHRSHILTKKSTSRKRKLRKIKKISHCDVKSIKLMLPNLK